MTGRIRRLTRTAEIIVALLSAGATTLQAAQASTAAPVTSAQQRQSAATSTSSGIAHSNAAVAYTLQNALTSRCLADSLASGPRAVSCDGLNDQEFTFPLPQPDGSSEIANVRTAHCLNDNLASGLSSAACTGSNSQLWQTLYFRSDLYQIKNAQTGRCIDDSSKSGLRMVACTYGPPTDQQWIL